jgi:hypothetical protein
MDVIPLIAGPAGCVHTTSVKDATNSNAAFSVKVVSLHKIEEFLVVAAVTMVSTPPLFLGTFFPNVLAALEP